MFNKRDKSTTLTAAEQTQVLAFVRETFGERIPGAQFAKDIRDLPLLDKTTSAPFYNAPRPDMAGARAYGSTGTSGAPKGLWWTDAEDRWYIGDKRAKILPHVQGCSRVFISLGLGATFVGRRVGFGGGGGVDSGACGRVGAFWGGCGVCVAVVVGGVN